MDIQPANAKILPSLAHRLLLAPPAPTVIPCTGCIRIHELSRIEQLPDLIFLAVLELYALEQVLDLQPFLPVLVHLVLTDQPVGRRALPPPVHVGQVRDVFLH